MGDFRDELQTLINYHSKENGSDTPDWILAGYLESCLELFDKTMVARERWYGRSVGGVKEPAKRPTIADLEAILNSPEKPQIDILPNGEVRAREPE